jgi:hypothetical protein
MNVDPEVLYQQLSETATTRTRKSLEIVHDVCRDQKNSGGTDFSYATIGRLTKKRGGVGERSIYNPTTSGKVYRAQIDAWARKATNSIKSKRQDEIPNDWGILDAIEKPSVRAEVSILLSKVRKLEGQVSEFRQAANQDRVINLCSSAGLSYNKVLSETELNALRNAISPSFLSQQNWMLDKAGDIRTARGGARILPREYVTAIRAILGESDNRMSNAPRQLGD